MCYRAEEVLKLLGEEDTDSVLRTGRRKVRPVRDLAMYALSQMSIYTNKEIGEDRRFYKTERLVVVRIGY